MIKTYVKANVEIVGLALFSLIALSIVGGRLIDVYICWYHRIGPAILLFFPAGATLFAILFLIFTGRIDERFPSLTELDLLVDGSQMLGLIGTVSGMIAGFAKLGAGGSTGDFSMNVLMQIISETFFCTGLGLTLSFVAWITKKKLFPEELRKKILAKKSQLHTVQEEVQPEPSLATAEERADLNNQPEEAGGAF